jgi:hypothetical protein
MLQREALRRRGGRSSLLQVSFDFATHSLFRVARVFRVGDRVLGKDHCRWKTRPSGQPSLY